MRDVLFNAMTTPLPPETIEQLRRLLSEATTPFAQACASPLMAEIVAILPGLLDERERLRLEFATVSKMHSDMCKVAGARYDRIKQLGGADVDIQAVLDNALAALKESRG
jgi:hypothetical protein